MRRNLLLVGFLLVAGGLHWLLAPDPSRRNYEFLPGMLDSLAHDAQAAAPALPDGRRVDLRPAEGSVARGFLPLAYAATREDAERAGRELVSPFAADDAAALARGASVYASFCAVCHGAGGKGDGPVTLRGVPPPPSLLLEHAVAMSDGQMYHVISLGQGNMAAYASQVERDDRWRAILHVRSLQKAAAAIPVAPAAAAIPPAGGE